MSRRRAAARLEQIRKDLGLTQLQLAEELGCSDSFVCKLETDRLPPNLGILGAYETVLLKRGRLKTPFLIRDWL